jgi:hypothetical protein
MKKIFLGLGLLLAGVSANAQNGLESIIVEKYYVANAADAAGSTGTLPVGSVTYRFYVDMLPGYKFQVAYGTPAHTLSISTSTTFFNNEDRGSTFPTYTKTQARANTVMLDSWLSAGAGCAGNFGILKSEDDGVANVANSNGILANNNASAGIPLTTQDGLIAGSPSSVTTVGQADAQLAASLDATSQAGSSFVLTDGAWSSLAGTQGPTANNRILIAQITTDGILTYNFNIQIGTPTGGVERYVTSDPTGAEIVIPSLQGTLGAPNALPTVSITSPATGTGFITGSTVNIAATAADAGGSITGVEFFAGSTSLGTDNTAPYTATYTAATIGTFNLTAVATDNEGATTTSSIVVINVQNNPAPNVAITAPTAGASFVTGDVVNITATATDNGSVTGVEFFVGTTSIGTDNTAPYTATYTTATTGTFSLTAVATDNLGLSATSAGVSITVVNNLPPTATLTAPVVTSLFTAPAVVTVSANATDPDGTVAQVEFFVNGASIGVDATAPYEVNWTSVVGSASFTARSTDNRGATRTSSAVVINIADPNALPYAIETSVNVCNEDSFCLPLNVVDAVANVIGYDVTIAYNNTKVVPTGVVTMASDLINPSFVDVFNSIDAVNGRINITVSFNASAPANTRFTGSGELFCVKFNKIAGFTSVDTAAFTVPFLQESYFTGVQSRLVQSGKYIAYRDTVYNGTIKVWTDNSVMPYNEANPNQFLITNIAGTDASCANESATLVQPDLNGNFVYSSNNGLSIAIKKDIVGTSDVQSVINGFDGLLTRRVLLNDVSQGLPSIYNIIAMDVNLDGVVSAGDNSQIAQRSVLLIPEFKQAWNYDINGVSNGEASKDWAFIDSTLIASNTAYAISATYPLNDGVGFSKSNVPVTPFCLPIKVTNYAICPDYTPETYKAIMVGDVNGNVATASPSSLFKSASEKVIFNLSNAVVSGNTVEVPVSVVSSNAVGSIDFSMPLNSNVVTFNEISNVAKGAESLSYFNTDNNTLRFTSYHVDNFKTDRLVATVKFNLVNGGLSESDLAGSLAFINGENAEVAFVGSIGSNNVDYTNVVSVFPNPASSFVQVITPELATVQLMDAAGRIISTNMNVTAGQALTLSTVELASGVYFVKISNENFSVNKKIVVNN